MMKRFDVKVKRLLLGLLLVLGLGLFMTVSVNATSLPPLSKTGAPAKAKPMPQLPVSEEHNAPVNLEAVKTPPLTIEFEGSTYTLLKDDELKSTLSNIEISNGIRGEVFSSNGGYSRWSDLSVLSGFYKIANNKVYTGGRTPDWSRAFYKNSAGEFIAISTATPEGEKKPQRVRLEPRNQ